MASAVSTDTRPALRVSGDERAWISCRAPGACQSAFSRRPVAVQGPVSTALLAPARNSLLRAKNSLHIPCWAQKNSLLARAGNFAVKTLKSKAFSAHFFTKKGRFPCNFAARREFSPVRGASHPTSSSRSASASSTDTIWLTPRSAIVTPNSRSMRAMVIGLWVMVTKRVSARLRISSSRSQKRSTL